MPSVLALDVETDPLAYLARGHSLHLGLRWSRLRFDLGAFGAVVPEFMHGVDDFEQRMNGYGGKLDFYFEPDQRGLFVGVEGALVWLDFIEQHSQTLERRTSVVAGVRAGYELRLQNGFYVKPWLGVGHNFDSKDVMVAGRTFDQNALMIFPTVHVGYVFPRI